MGKRKTKRKPRAKIKQKLDTQFNCLFCNHDKSVSAKLNKNAGVGEVKCRVCQITWQTNITPLSHAIDVYSDWIDACEENNRVGAEGRAAGDVGVAPNSAAAAMATSFNEREYFDEQAPTSRTTSGDYAEDGEEDEGQYNSYPNRLSTARFASRKVEEDYDGGEEEEEESSTHTTSRVARA